MHESLLSYLVKGKTTRRSRPLRRRPVSIRPAVEVLEDRTLLSAFTVNSFADTHDANPGDGVAVDSNGNTSLRAAVEESNALNGDDTINLPIGTYSLSLGQLSATDTTGGLTISGAAANVTTIDANQESRVFQVSPGATLNIEGVTITGGYVDNTLAGEDGLGGGILNQGTLSIINSTVSQNEGGGIASRPQGTLTIEGSTISNNSAETNGAGIDFVVDGAVRELTITNSTISGNSAPGHSGGGIFIIGTGGGPLVTITNSTITDNTANIGGGISIGSGTVNVMNTIIAGNSAGTSADVSGSLSSSDHNLIGVDPMLGPLQDNGGPTFTHALLAGSPAIDAGSNGGAPATDQRGITRPSDGNNDGNPVVDIGAFELNDRRGVTKVGNVGEAVAEFFIKEAVQEAVFAALGLSGSPAIAIGWAIYDAIPLIGKGSELPPPEDRPPVGNEDHPPVGNGSDLFSENDLLGDLLVGGIGESISPSLSEGRKGGTPRG